MSDQPPPIDWNVTKIGAVIGASLAVLITALNYLPRNGSLDSVPASAPNGYESRLRTAERDIAVLREAVTKLETHIDKLAAERERRFRDLESRVDEINRATTPRRP